MFRSFGRSGWKSTSETQAKISKVTVKFFAKLYGNFVVETSDSQAEDAKWTEIKSVEMPSGNDANIIKEVDVTKDGEPVEVSRYLRFAFHIRKHAGCKPWNRCV